MVTGHSLGAGVACILSYLLRPVYPRLSCITYGTPNAVFDEVTAHDCTDFMVSVSNQGDVVCRAGFKPCVRTRAEVRTRLV